MSPRLAALLAALCCTTSSPVRGANTVMLAPASCRSDIVAAHGFETPQLEPGADVELALSTGFGPRVAHARSPARVPGQLRPVLIALHGAGGAGTQDGAARAVRDAARALADQEGFIVIAPVSGGASGGWDPAPDTALVRAAAAHAVAQLDGDPARLYLWGYSAGGHFAHGLVLYDTARWAAYAVNAGALAAYAQIDAPQVAAQTRRVPVLLRVGTSDPLRAHVAADRMRFLDAGWVEPAELRHQEPVMGHVYGSADLAAAWAHLCGYAVAP